MAKTDDILAEIKTALAADAAFTADGIHVINDKLVTGGTLIEDAIGQSLEDDGLAVVLRIDGASNPHPNVPGPQLDPTLKVEILFDAWAGSSGNTLRHYTEAAAAVLHLFGPASGRIMFTASGDFWSITEEGGYLVGTASFTTPLSGA